MTEKIETLVRKFRLITQEYYDKVKEYSDECVALEGDELEEFHEMVGRVPMGILMVVKAHPEEGKQNTFAINLSYPQPTGPDDPILEGATDMFTGVMAGLEPINAKSMAIQMSIATVRASGMAALETSNQLASNVLEEGYMVSRLIQAKFQERMQALAAAGKMKVGPAPAPQPEQPKDSEPQP